MKRVIPYPYTSSQSKLPTSDIWYLLSANQSAAVITDIKIINAGSRRKLQYCNLTPKLLQDKSVNCSDTNFRYFCDSLGFCRRPHTVRPSEPYQPPHNTYYTRTYCPKCQDRNDKAGVLLGFMQGMDKKVFQTECRTVRFIFSSGTGKSFSPVPYSSLHSPQFFFFSVVLPVANAHGYILQPCGLLYHP